MSSRVPAVLTLSLVILVCAAPAQGAPGPVRLISKSATEQADRALAPAISADGRYVAFQGSIDGLTGVFREELTSGEIEPVSAGDAYLRPAPVQADASAPSISADGRYVAFSTTASLDPTDDDPPPPAKAPADRDVYVADMSATPPTYELASARDGSQAGLTYAANSGSLATGRVALSADGRRVVFVTTTASDLTAAPGATQTPTGQVAVRDLDARQTTLISARRDPETGLMTSQPVSGGAVAGGFGGVAMGASLSADGSTVAWLGANLPAQVPVLAGESLAFATGIPYDEPLWRRVPSAEDPAPPTRRIVGGADALAPGCSPASSVTEPACQGPFPTLSSTAVESTGCELFDGWILAKTGLDAVPALSADGHTVALLGEPEGFANLYLVDMGEGVPRVHAVRPLTRELPAEDPCLANQAEYEVGSGDLTGVAISADGSRLSFATRRQRFPLAPPNLVTAPPAAEGQSELYLVDLEAQTLQRLTHGIGSPSEPSLGPEVGSSAGASAPSLSADGTMIAFASGASNLVAADANGASDAFLVEDPRDPPVPGAGAISAPPPPLRSTPRWRLSAAARSLRDGAVALSVAVPGPGRLAARASAAPASGAPTGRIASAVRQTGGEAVLRLVLHPTRRYRRVVRSRGGLEADLTLSFSGPGGHPLSRRLDVRFRLSAGGRR